MKSTWKSIVFFDSEKLCWKEKTFKSVFMAASSFCIPPLKSFRERDWIVQSTMIYWHNRQICMWPYCILIKTHCRISFDCNQCHLFMIWFLFIFKDAYRALYEESSKYKKPSKYLQVKIWCLQLRNDLYWRLYQMDQSIWSAWKYYQAYYFAIFLFQNQQMANWLKIQFFNREQIFDEQFSDEFSRNKY